jgi:hypothetical protein
MLSISIGVEFVAGRFQTFIAISSPGWELQINVQLLRIRIRGEEAAAMRFGLILASPVLGNGPNAEVAE